MVSALWCSISAHLFVNQRLSYRDMQQSLLSSRTMAEQMPMLNFNQKRVTNKAWIDYLCSQATFVQRFLYIDQLHTGDYYAQMIVLTLSNSLQRFVIFAGTNGSSCEPHGHFVVPSEFSTPNFVQISFKCWGEWGIKRSGARTLIFQFWPIEPVTVMNSNEMHKDLRCSFYLCVDPPQFSGGRVYMYYFESMNTGLSSVWFPPFTIALADEPRDGDDDEIDDFFIFVEEPGRNVISLP